MIVEERDKERGESGWGRLREGVVRKRWSRYGSLEAHPPISPVPFDEHASCSKSINGDSRRSRTTRPTAVDPQLKPKKQERTRRKPYGDEKDRSQTQVKERRTSAQGSERSQSRLDLHQNKGRNKKSWPSQGRVDSRSGFLTDSQAKAERFDARRRKKKARERREETRVGRISRTT